jgi:ABC-type transporter Mla maintaining outer membrane lipid asymmetry ATPase subunit MlaF
MIRVVDVVQHYGVRPVLRQVSLEVQSGELVVILGANGTGKTTLLGVMAGVLDPQDGFVEIDGLRRRISVEVDRALDHPAIRPSASGARLRTGRPVLRSELLAAPSFRDPA